MHSCGCIFDVMDDLINAGINAKHSNEDQIAPYQRWIDDYGQRIGLFGGVDVNVLCLNEPEVVYERVVEMGTQFRATANGYALGSGNSIPKYVPVEGYRAMVRAVQEIRKREDGGA
jgi:uroporphyrinogen decarboxylase